MSEDSGALSGSRASTEPCGLGPSGFDPERMAMFLEILASTGGSADASDGYFNWINAFCEEHEGRDPDTFNSAIDAGYVDWSHDSDSDCSTIRLTDKGRHAIAMEARRAETVQHGSVADDSAAIAQPSPPISRETRAA